MTDGRCRVAALVGLLWTGQGDGAMVVRAVQAAEAEGPSIAGEYVCTADCHYSDAPPAIEVEGQAANCRSQTGGIFFGKLLNRTMVACFNITGTLSADGTTILWSNGGRWERRR